MPFCSHAQLSTLQSWSFVSEYTSRRAELVDVGRIVYKTLEGALKRAPTPTECLSHLAFCLLGTKVFAAILQRKQHLPPTLYNTVAVALASYLLDTDWADVAKP